MVQPVRATQVTCRHVTVVERSALMHVSRFMLWATAHSEHVNHTEERSRSDAGVSDTFCQPPHSLTKEPIGPVGAVWLLTYDVHATCMQHLCAVSKQPEPAAS